MVIKDSNGISRRQYHTNRRKTDARYHLSSFGNTALRTIISLSAGQRVRLCLAQQQLGGQHPSLLILDKVSENLDLDTRNSLLDLLNTFIGAVIAVSTKTFVVISNQLKDGQ